MNKRLLKLLCPLAAVCVLLSGCWQDTPPMEDPDSTPTEPGEAAEDVPSGPLLPESLSLPYAPDQSLDPVTCPDGAQQVIASLLYEGLFHLGPDLEPENLLCGSYTYDPAQFVYTFTLRPGLLFSDGSPVTARDVRSTLERARQSQRYQARLSQMASVSAKDNTVTITLNRPNTGFPALLDIPIVKEGTQDSAAPVGTGPYLLSHDGGGAFLTANLIWWQNSDRPVDRINLVEAPGQDTVLYRFTSHEVQLITADLTGSSPVTLTGSVGLQDADTTVFQYLGCNTAVPPLDNAALRRALWNGVNRSQVTGGLLSNHAVAAQFPVSPRSSLYPHALERPFSSEDLPLAVTQSAYILERPLTLLVNEENGFKISAAEYLAESFTAAGIPVETRALPWAEYTAALETGDFDLYYGEVRLTADWDLSTLLSTGGSLNYTGWSDERTDSLLSAYAAAADRAAAMEALCTHLQQQAPILPICFKSVSVLTQAGVLEGLTPTAAEPFYNLAVCTVHLRES